ncbi:MAG: hypothetical protein IPJ74_23040 [Saprospiraceae bacterium]|nr:hypothetical protein [Saprospiraceae bacterium]
MEGILFVGDSKAGKLFALDLNDRTVNASKEAFELADIEGKLANLLGTDRQGVIIHDIAVNKISQNIYIAASRADANQLGFWKLPNDITYANILLKVTSDGKISEVDLNDIRHSVTEVPNVINEGKQNWRKSDERTDAITDIAYDDGKLYIAGLSNEEFASVLRVLDFPFGKTAHYATMEVWHVAHGKWETESPIRTLFPYQINGKKYLLASYTCTPFVSIPVSDIKPGSHVKNKTLAEFGSGNMPVDIITYQKNGKEYLLMSNSSKALIRVNPDNIPKQEKGLTEPLKNGEYAVGLQHDVLSKVGIMHIDNYNAEHVMLLQRMPNGMLNLVAYPTQWL